MNKIIDWILNHLTKPSKEDAWMHVRVGEENGASPRYPAARNYLR